MRGFIRRLSGSFCRLSGYPSLDWFFPSLTGVYPSLDVRVFPSLAKF
ncbi:hypothetical protein LSPCS325_41000 [Lysinibacillus sp. CTST325]